MDDKLAVAKLHVYYQQNQTSIPDKPEYNVKLFTQNNRPMFTANLKYAGQTKEGTGPSKNEAKRLAACQMLDYLHNKHSTNSVTQRVTSLVQPQTVQLEEFDAKKLSVRLDDYLEKRERNSKAFHREFTKNVADNLADHFNNINAGFKSDTSPNSETLNKIMAQKLEISDSKAPWAFDKIMQDMNLKYYAEFVETAKNDKYVVMIKVNYHLFTTYGIGNSPEKAIQMSCKNAIEFLTAFNS